MYTEVIKQLLVACIVPEEIGIGDDGMLTSNCCFVASWVEHACYNEDCWFILAHTHI